MRLQTIVVGALLAVLAIAGLVIVWQRAPGPLERGVVEGLAGPQPSGAAPPSAPAAAPAAPAAGPLSASLHFDFDSAELSRAEAAKLDPLLGRLKAKGVRVEAIGHADRIGRAAYNLRLSERRAAAVKEYLAEKAVPAEAVHIAGRGELEPASGDACVDLGPETGRNTTLASCLRRDRRVEVSAAPI
jgi:OmpA-OmpF porin, OOP family